MIKAEVFEVSVRRTSPFGGSTLKYDFSEIEDFINHIGKENVLSITSSIKYPQSDTLYTVFYDDGK